jgi:hypothetical protein
MWQAMVLHIRSQTAVTRLRLLLLFERQSSCCDAPT